MSDLLDGKVCIVAGGGGDLGRATAEELAANGVTVVVTDLGTSLGGEGTEEWTGDNEARASGLDTVNTPF